jgi:hypothetical protein
VVSHNIGVAVRVVTEVARHPGWGDTEFRLSEDGLGDRASLMP